ncbi:SCO family protein [Marinimicrobium sp. C2-29]|uniref:SCO family protein n=1 Tax=Marinimicrobium sp. C2-29 TaxID=3139825 RepID=UPI00313A27B8
MNKCRFSTLLALWALSAWSMAADHPQGDHHGHHHTQTPLPMASGVSGESLHQLDIQWQTHRGEALTLGDLAGRNVIVTMIYASCNTACPVLVQDVRRVYQALDAERRERTDLLVVSFDSERDTPERLQRYAEGVGAVGPEWHFATASASDVRTLAALLGVRYRKNPQGGYDHSNLVAVLSPEGELVHRLEGLNQPAAGALGHFR